VLNLTGHTVGLLDQSNTNTSYASTNAANINTTVGFKIISKRWWRFYGNLSFNTTELKTIRESGWLIND
jgi:hypothetical protein